MAIDDEEAFEDCVVCSGERGREQRSEGSAICKLLFRASTRRLQACVRRATRWAWQCQWRGRAHGVGAAAKGCPHLVLQDPRGSRRRHVRRCEPAAAARCHLDARPTTRTTTSLTRCAAALVPGFPGFPVSRVGRVRHGVRGAAWGWGVGGRGGWAAVVLYLLPLYKTRHTLHF